MAEIIQFRPIFKNATAWDRYRAASAEGGLLVRRLSQLDVLDRSTWGLQLRLLKAAKKKKDEALRIWDKYIE